MERLSQSPPIFHSFTIFSLHVYYKLSRNSIQYLESARNRSYSGLHFPSFGLNGEIRISLRIQSECRKVQVFIVTV